MFRDADVRAEIAKAFFGMERRSGLYSAAAERPHPPPRHATRLKKSPVRWPQA